MKLAIVYDWLNVKVGGGEQLLFDVAKLYPDADIFALTYNKHLFKPFLGTRKIHTSFLNKFPRTIKNHPELLLPLIASAVGSWDFSDYDVVLSISTAWSKNITVPEGVVHICYCQSPARMLWDSWPKYLLGKKIGRFSLGPFSRFLTTIIASRVRLWDYYGTTRVSQYYANSDYIRSRILKFYGRESQVLYPPVRLLLANQGIERQDYYLVVSVLSKYKNLEMAINACKQLKRKLVIAGDGPDRTRLERLAAGSKFIRFEGYVSNDRRNQLMSAARGFIFPSIEDFGITPVEAMSAGTPVIALRGGGLAETIVEGQSGVFFDNPTVDCLVDALGNFEEMSWDEDKIHKSVVKFGADRFALQIKGIIKQAAQHDR